MHFFDIVLQKSLVYLVLYNCFLSLCMQACEMDFRHFGQCWEYDQGLVRPGPDCQLHVRKKEFDSCFIIAFRFIVIVNLDPPPPRMVEVPVTKMKSEPRTRTVPSSRVACRSVPVPGTSSYVNIQVPK